MSERLFPDLADSLEWNLVGRRNLQGIEVRTGWYNIPPQDFLIDSYVCQVGLRNPSAFTHWWLGAYAEMVLPISPSSTTEFVSAVTAAQLKVKLNSLNLLVFPKLVKPWILRLTFPKWHEQIQLEVWRYDGLDISPATTSEQFR